MCQAYFPCLAHLFSGQRARGTFGQLLPKHRLLTREKAEKIGFAAGGFAARRTHPPAPFSSPREGGGLRAAAKCRRSHPPFTSPSAPQVIWLTFSHLVLKFIIEFAPYRQSGNSPPHTNSGSWRGILPPTSDILFKGSRVTPAGQERYGQGAAGRMNASHRYY